MEHNKRLETESKIRELRHSIEALEQELNDSAGNERAQHELVDHLDEYINAVETKVSSLKLFWQTLKQEWQNK